MLTPFTRWLERGITLTAKDSLELKELAKLRNEEWNRISKRDSLKGRTGKSVSEKDSLDRAKFSRTLDNITLNFIKSREIESVSIGAMLLNSSNGISPWRTKSSGVGKTFNYHVGETYKNLEFGVSIIWNKHHDSFNDAQVKMTENQELYYFAPQLAYITTRRNKKFYATLGGGMGYIIYKSNGNLPDDRVTKVRDGALGLNASLNIYYKLGKKSGIKLEATELYSRINPHYKKYTYSPFERRGAFNLFATNLQIGYFYETNFFK